MPTKRTSVKPLHFTLNINSIVRYKPTARGLEIHRRNWEDLNNMAGGALARISPYRPPQVDEEGYAAEELWCVMREYGAGMGNGLSVPIKTDIQIDARDLFPAD